MCSERKCVALSRFFNERNGLHGETSEKLVGMGQLHVYTRVVNIFSNFIVKVLLCLVKCQSVLTQGATLQKYA